MDELNLSDSFYVPTEVIGHFISTYNPPPPLKKQMVLM